MPINKPIESSSEESGNDSYCSGDTVVARSTDTQICTCVEDIVLSQLSSF